MYLHLGQSVVVPETAVIGVFDLDKTTSSRITRGFLNAAEKSGRVVNVSDDLPNSFIVCGASTTRRHNVSSAYNNRDKTKKAGDAKVYLSQLSTQTLFKRSGTTW